VHEITAYTFLTTCIEGFEQTQLPDDTLHVCFPLQYVSAGVITRSSSSLISTIVVGASLPVQTGVQTPNQPYLLRQHGPLSTIGRLLPQPMPHHFPTTSETLHSPLQHSGISIKSLACTTEPL
jgi:hypothetical protein